MATAGFSYTECRWQLSKALEGSWFKSDQGIGDCPSVLGVYSTLPNEKIFLKVFPPKLIYATSFKGDIMLLSMASVSTVAFSYYVLSAQLFSHDR